MANAPDKTAPKRTRRTPAWRRWLVRGTLGVAALLVVLAAGVRILAATAPGAALVESRLDGMALGGLGTIHVDGISGDLLRDIRIGHLSIRDADGAWLEIENARLRWRPRALVHRTLRVDLASADRVDLFRLPPGGGSSGSSSSGGGWGVRLDEARFPDIGLGEAVAGQAARLSAQANIDVDRRGAVDLSADVTRTDAPGDAATLRLVREVGGRLTGGLNLDAAPGGPLAMLLGEADRGVSARAGIDGDARAGAGEGVVQIGEADLLNVTVNWTAGALRLDGEADLSVASLTRDAASRLGGPVSVEAGLAPEDANGDRDLTVVLASPALRAEASGAIDVRRRRVAGGLAVKAVSEDPNALIGVASLSLDRIEADGRLTLDAGAMFEGDVALEGIDSGGMGAGRVSGPVTARLQNGAAVLAADVAVESVTGLDSMASLLGETAQVAIDASARLDLSSAEVRSFTLEGRALTLDGTAQYDGAAGVVRANMGFNARDLAGTPTLDAGGLIGAVQIETPVAGGPIAVSAEASGSDISFVSALLNDLAGPEPSLTLKGDWAEGRFSISQAELNGARVVAEAAGSAGLAQLDLDVDAAVSGPFALGPAELAGAVAAGARIEGSLKAPSVRLDARADTVVFGGRSIEELRVRVDADGGDAWSGLAQVDGVSQGQPITGSARFRTAGGDATVSNITGSFVDWTLGGALAVDGGGPVTGAVTLRQGEDRLRLTTTLLNWDGAQAFDVEIAAGTRDLPSGVRLDAAEARLTGDFSGFGVTGSLTGEAVDPFELSVDGDVSLSDGAAARLTFAGSIGDRAIATTAPITLTTQDGVALAGAVSVGEGRFELDVRRPSVGAATVRAVLSDLPLDLVNAFVPEPHLAGFLDGDVDLSGETALEGTLSLSARDIRDPNAESNDAVSATFNGDARGGRLTGSARVADATELSAEGTLDYPVTFRPVPPFVDIRKDDAVSARARAAGPIGNVASLILSEDRAARGDLDATAEMSGTPADPRFSGQIGLTNGRFEDGGVGFVLTGAEANARFDGPRLVLDRFAGSDGNGGRISIVGEADFAAEDDVTADVVIELTEMRLTDRGDARVVASGVTNLTRRDGQSRVVSNVHVDQADLEPPEAGPPGVVTLEVVELNRPDNLAPPPRKRGPPIFLNIKIDADRRVFVRSQGLQTEWAFDVTVTGTARDPVITGTATLIKGDLEIVGERFILDEGEIVLEGDVASARIDMTARRDAEDLVAIVKVTGTPEEPRISLSSEPAYPEDEILARVLFGRSASQLTALEAAQLAAALASLANGGGGGLDLLGSLRRGLGVDRLSVSRAEGGAVVSGGKYIADNVYLEVSSGADGGASEAAIEWEIRPRVELVSKFGSQRDASLSLRWRRDY